jgi:uncharacterized protein (DUF58 family)
MLFTTRALLLLALAGVIVLYASHGADPVPAALVLDGLWLAAVLADIIITPRPPAVIFRRIVPANLQCGVDNVIGVEVENRSGRSLVVAFRDDPPLSIKATVEPVKAILPPGGKLESEYVVKPLSRTSVVFGRAQIRITGVLGLVIRQYAAGESEEARVVPAVTDILKTLSPAARRSSREPGSLRSLQRGMGTEFESLREYHRDDEYRNINWKASARRMKLIVECFEEDRTETVILALDTGRLMRADVDGLERLEHALRSSLLLAHLALERDDRVGMLFFSDKVGSFLPPDKGKRQLQSLFSLTRKAEATGVETDYFQLIEYLDGRHRKRSLVAIFTDFTEQGAAENLVRYVPKLYPRHLPLVVMIQDPALAEMAEAEAGDSESLFRKAVAVDLKSERQRAAAALRKQGVLVLDCIPRSLSPELASLYSTVKRKGLL